MAEGFFQRYLGDKHAVASAGLNPQGVNPHAVKVMAEVDVDLSGNLSNHVNEFIDKDFDFVITVCDNAAKDCPVFPGEAKKLHWPFDDPADAMGDEEEILAEFRSVRDQIAARIKRWLADQSNQ
jgi:arsenate reductase